MLCYAMLLYIAMLCCYVMLLCYVMLCYIILCYVMLCYAMLCYVMLCYAMLCYDMLCYVMLCYDMLCYAMLCYVMLCSVMLCYAYQHFQKYFSYNVMVNVIIEGNRNTKNKVTGLPSATNFILLSCTFNIMTIFAMIVRGNNLMAKEQLLLIILCFACSISKTSITFLM